MKYLKNRFTKLSDYLSDTDYSVCPECGSTGFNGTGQNGTAFHSEGRDPVYGNWFDEDDFIGICDICSADGCGCCFTIIKWTKHNITNFQSYEKGNYAKKERTFI